MKRRTLALYAIFIIAAIWVLSTSNTNPTPSQRVRRNAPPPCSGCHSNQQIDTGNDFKITGLPSVIVPGETYTLTVRITSGDPAIFSRPAFEFVIISDNDTDMSAGTFPCDTACGAGSSNRWHIDKNINTVDGMFNFARTTYPVTSFTSGENGIRTWEIDWRADGVSPGEMVKLYAHAIIGNGLGNPTLADPDFQDWGEGALFLDTAIVCAPPLVVTTSSAAPVCNSPLSGTATVNTAASTYIWAGESQRQSTARGLAPGTYSVLVANANNCETRQVAVPAISDNQAPVFNSCPTSITLPANQPGCSRIVSYDTLQATDECNKPLTFTQNIGATIIKGVWSSSGQSRAHLRLIPIDSAQAISITDIKVGIYKSIGANAQIRLYAVNPGSSLNNYSQLSSQIYPPAPNPNLNVFIPAMNNGVFCHTLASLVILPANKDLVVELRCTNSLNVRGGYTDQASGGISYFAETPGSGMIENVNTQSFPFFETDHFYCKVNAYRTGSVPVITQLSGLPSGASFPVGTTNMVFRAMDAAGNTANCSFSITIEPTLVSNAGINQTICAGNVVSLTGVVTGTATSHNWTTSGTGTFSNASVLNTSYTPSPGDIALGGVTLTLTANNPSGPCPTTTDQTAITITPNPFSINAGANQAICSGASVVLTGEPTGTSSVSWSTTTPGGTFFPSPNNSSVTYTPPPGFTGTIELTLTTSDPPGACPAVSDAMMLTVSAAATSNAGANQTVCGNVVTLNATPAAGGSWSGGNGTFSQTNNPAATYTAAPNEVGININLTWSVPDPDGTGPCNGANDQVTITLNAPATVTAGADQAICVGNTATLTGSFGGSATSGNWTTNGSGTFTVINAQTATYTPSAADINAGTVMLTYTTNDPGGLCPAVSDAMMLHINPAPPSNAGTNQTVCGSVVTLNATPAAGGSWSGGNGTFSNAANPAATYTAAPNEIGTNINLTWTLPDPDGTGPCIGETDQVVITLNTPANVSAGADQAICAGSTAIMAAAVGGSAISGIWTSDGSGTFNNPTSPLAVYTPSPADIADGSLILTYTTNNPDGPCPAVSDVMMLNIAPTVTSNAGANQTVCGNTVTLSATPAAGGSWSGGNGTFSNPANPAATYTAASNEVGTNVNLTWTVPDPDGVGPCTSASDQVTITLNAPATVTAGADQTICAGNTAAIAAVLAGSATSGTWTSDGSGIFNNPASSMAVYAPSAGDIADGSIVLTYTTNNPDGPCPAVSDVMMLNIAPAVTSNAGANQTVCGNTVTLSATPAAGGSWSGGNGTFSNPNNPAATYTAASNEVGTNVNLTWTVPDPDGLGPCTSATDQVTIALNTPAIVTAGADQTICTGNTAVMAAVLGGSATTGTWTSDGSGTFNNVASAMAVYTPSAADIADGSIVLTYSTNNPDGPCPAVSDVMTLNINPTVTSNAGASQSVCGNTVILNATPAIGGSWSGGAGTFSNSANPAATYTAASNEVGTNVNLTWTVPDPDGLGPCTSATDQVTITLNTPAIVTAGADQTICTGNTAVMAATLGGSATSGTWISDGSGTFNNPASETAVYTPSLADIADGAIILTYTTNEPSGPCPAVSDVMTLNINPAVTSNAGANQIVCGNVVILSATPATGGSWSGGNGTFSNSANPAATYTATPNEVGSNINLTWTVADPDGAGPCTSASDQVAITLNNPANVNAGPDQTVCTGDNAVMDATVGGSANNATWTSSGSGSFSNATSSGATYFPSATDIAAGIVSLIYTTNDPAGPCPAVADTTILNIVPNTIDAIAILSVPSSGINDAQALVVISGGIAPYRICLNRMATNICQTNILQDSTFFNNLPPGSYSVSITDAAGCTFTTIIEILVGTKELLPESAITIFPNPSDNKLWVQSSAIALNKAEIRLLDVKGRHLMRHPLDVQPVDIGMLPPGTYWAAIWLDGKLMARKLIVIAR